ncbi:MAG TPA: tyrosine-type recombinase/integrase [Alloacidobacterium sp.]|nr:tyrosine-type recombinase/integrase [Alloacidobacterium sp.]
MATHHGSTTSSTFNIFGSSTFSFALQASKREEPHPDKIQASPISRSEFPIPQIPIPKTRPKRRVQRLDIACIFGNIADTWLENHKLYIKPATYRTYGQYVNTLKQIFAELPINKIGINDVRSYQRWRQQSAGATRINAEASVLQMILKEVGIWERFAELYIPLPVPKKKVRQNMSEEEERRLVAVALDSSRPRRLLAGHCLIVMANTSMGFGELRNLRREDVLLNEDQPFVTVNGGTKNDYRIRTIPLNFLALRSMRWIVKRWDKLGGTEPEQYILPHHARRPEGQQKAKGHKRTEPPIFTEPMGHIYRAARGILKEAGLSHLDPYDMRSHFITKLAADPDVSDQLYKEIVGHCDLRMRGRYSKQRLGKKAEALSRLCLEAPNIAPVISFPGGKVTA